MFLTHSLSFSKEQKKIVKIKKKETWLEQWIFNQNIETWCKNGTHAKVPERRSDGIKAVFYEEGSLGVMQDKLGEEVIKNQRGYADKWGPLRCPDYSFGYKKMNDKKETEQVSFS